MRRWREFLAAVTLLTRLPVGGWMRGAWPAGADAVWAYPIVGMLVGGAGGLVLLAGQLLALPRNVAATLAVTTMVLLSGGLHEDGLADTADGFGGGATAARKLEIMRDSRIGSYGALALVITTALRLAVLAALAPGAAALALLAAGALGRGAMVLVLLLLRPARADGSAAGLGRVRGAIGLCGLVFAAAGSFWLPWPRAVLCCVAVSLAACLVARLAWRQIGGTTGDVLGFTAVVCECVVLVVASLSV